MKLDLYNEPDKPLPESWAIDATGKGSNDAARVLGNIIAGCGNGILCEIFTAILSLGVTSNHTERIQDVPPFQTRR